MALKPVCTWCLKPIDRAPSLCRSKRLFCSRDCRTMWAHHPIRCPGCGETFPRDPKFTGRKYCSWDCYKRSRHVTLTCAVCGKQFQSYLSERRKRKARSHVACCSRACRNVYTSRLLGGDGTWMEGGRYNPKRSRPGWRKVRDAYMESVGGMCELCETEQAVDVHHLHPVADGGCLYSFDNLAAVCKRCHATIHEELRGGLYDDCLEAARCNTP